MQAIRAFAGIGDTVITPAEADTCRAQARRLTAAGFILYSGGAVGSDAAFEEGAGGDAVLFLPRGRPSAAVGAPMPRAVIEGGSALGNLMISNLHPNPAAVRGNAASTELLSRDAHQVLGRQGWPRVRFVLCCATPSDEHPAPHVKGGTGQAVRVAVHFGIPVVNIRVAGWVKALAEAMYAC